MKRLLKWVDSSQFCFDCVRIFVLVICFGVLLSMLLPKPYKQITFPEPKEIVEKSPEEEFMEFIFLLDKEGTVVKDVVFDEDVVTIYINSNNNNDSTMEAGIKLKETLDGFKEEFEITQDIWIVGQMQNGTDIWRVR